MIKIRNTLKYNNHICYGLVLRIIIFPSKEGDEE
jgi:hypothetical protein